MMYQGLFHQDYQKLGAAGLLPPNAHEPSLSFLGPEAGSRSYEVGSGGRGHVYVTPLGLLAATAPQVGGPMYAWGQQTPIHEMAHAWQSPQTQQDVVSTEGGAQAYTRATVPAALGPLMTYDTEYAPYVRQVESDPAWVMRGQFGSGRRRRRQSG